MRSRSYFNSFSPAPGLGASGIRHGRARLALSGSSTATVAQPAGLAPRTPTAPPLAAIAVMAAVALLGLPAQAQQAPAGEIEEVEGLTWSLVTNGDSVPWSDANEYCETLEHAGFDDWRLPTLAELETLHDPSEETGLRAPFELEDCCAWSSTSLVEIPPESKGVLPEPSQAPASYYWGFLYASGIRYYSFERFPDGLAMCVRD